MKKRRETSIATSIAPEDLQRGLYVAVLHEIGEHLPQECGESPIPGRVRPLRVQWLPWDDPEPLRVVDVCLPFVLVTDREGAIRTLDVRRHRLARLPCRYGQRAFRHKRSGRKRRSR